MGECPARVFLGSVFNDLHPETERLPSAVCLCCPIRNLFLLKVVNDSLNIKADYRCCFKEVF